MKAIISKCELKMKHKNDGNTILLRTKHHDGIMKNIYK